MYIHIYICIHTWSFKCVVLFQKRLYSSLEGFIDWFAVFKGLGVRVSVQKCRFRV